MDVMRDTEIEHKFVVDEAFDLPALRRALAALGPRREAALEVVDRYFLTADGRAQGYVLRHRFDAELQQLTLKSVSTDPEVRAEINLDLGHHRGDQTAAVDAFVARLGVGWRGELRKQLAVWYFADCEVVHYTATAGARRVQCVEFEAIGQASVADALAVIQRYEQATGFEPAARSRQSLLELLFPGVL
ncbi:MAG: hypothetical protein R2708_08595 [Vicinamibacterales bacterium]